VTAAAHAAHDTADDAADDAARWPVLERSLRDRHRSLIGWALGIGAYVALIVATWASIRGSSEISSAIEDYPDVMKEFFGGAEAFDYTKPGGFLNTQLFSLLLPLLLGAFAIGYGAGTLAGERQSGQLDLLLALPMTRARIVRQKAAALTAGVTGMTTLSAAVIVGVGALIDLDVGTRFVVAACVGSGLVALVHGLLALAVGAATTSRGVAIGASSAALLGGYLIQALSGLVDAFKPLRPLSAFHHANGSIPINTGFPIWRHLVLVAVCAVLAGVSIRIFMRRDLSW
jgi:ABC-2 type transport system permease protein